MRKTCSKYFNWSRFKISPSSKDLKSSFSLSRDSLFCVGSDGSMINEWPHWERPLPGKSMVLPLIRKRLLPFFHPTFFPVLSLSLSHYFTRLLVLLHPPTSFQAPPPETLGLEHSGRIRGTSRTLLMCSLMIKLCFSLLFFFFLSFFGEAESERPARDTVSMEEAFSLQLPLQLWLTLVIVWLWKGKYIWQEYAQLTV